MNSELKCWRIENGALFTIGRYLFFGEKVVDVFAVQWCSYTHYTRTIIVLIIFERNPTPESTSVN